MLDQTSLLRPAVTSQTSVHHCSLAGTKSAVWWQATGSDKPAQGFYSEVLSPRVESTSWVLQVMQSTDLPLRLCKGLFKIYLVFCLDTYPVTVLKHALGGSEPKFLSLSRKLCSLNRKKNKTKVIFGVLTIAWRFHKRHIASRVTCHGLLPRTLGYDAVTTAAEARTIVNINVQVIGAVGVIGRCQVTDNWRWRNAVNIHTQAHIYIHTYTHTRFNRRW